MLHGGDYFFPFCSYFFTLLIVSFVLVVGPCSYSLSYSNPTQSVIAPLMPWVSGLAWARMCTHTKKERGKGRFRSISKLNILGHKSSANIFVFFHSGLRSSWGGLYPIDLAVTGCLERSEPMLGPGSCPLPAPQWWGNMRCSFFWPCVSRGQVVLVWRIQEKMCMEHLAKGAGRGMAWWERMGRRGHALPGCWQVMWLQELLNLPKPSFLLC